jgi:hypothetical protein
MEAIDDANRGSLTPTFAYPSDLANSVQAKLQEMRRRSPPVAALRQMLEVAFFASMKTEEGEPIRCFLTYLNDKKPDPRKPGRIVADRWNWMRFAHPIPFTVANLTKVAKSIDSNVGSLAVCADGEGGLIAWGVIDQRNRRARYIMRESESGPEAPGVVEVSISGVGVLEVYKDYVLVAALRQGRLAGTFSDVLNQTGPIRSALEPAIERLVGRVRKLVGSDTFGRREHWPDSIAYDWTTALTRILLGVRRYQHGGALLLTPNDGNDGLALKYPLKYGRLADALVRLNVHTVQQTDASDQVFEQFLDKRAERMPVGLYLDETVSRNDREETRSEVTGCIRFIASLSRVDGTIVMDRTLSVRGYGGIINVKREPREVWSTRDPLAVVDLAQLDPKQLGTRHQSMMRICFHRPGSVGFVVSQDGDVRAMTRVDHRLVVWDDVKLQVA